MNEVMQNSLMISLVPKQQFWYEVVKSAEEIVNFVNHPEECFKNKWSGCDELMMFHNPLTKKAVNLIYTAFMTGPAVLDRTFALHIAGGTNKKNPHFLLFRLSFRLEARMAD
jgi:hypothetical protein